MNFVELVKLNIEYLQNEMEDSRSIKHNNHLVNCYRARYMLCGVGPD